jgi:predicted DCC family thiol-disulfide oxidoreductase YuxK
MRLHSVSKNKDTRRIIVFDGVCNLCEYSIQFIIRNDKDGKFLFVSAQSSIGAILQSTYEADTIKDGTVILIKNNTVYIKSDAALEIAKDLDGLWKLLYAFKILPKSIRDYFYSVISRYRYQWFGKKNTCLLPDNTIRSRFLYS